MYLVYAYAYERRDNPGRVEGSSHAMLATARPSCYYWQKTGRQQFTLNTRGTQTRGTGTQHS